MARLPVPCGCGPRPCPWPCSTPPFLPQPWCPCLCHACLGTEHLSDALITLSLDTLDLQAHEAPSAQRHLRPAPDGSLAPHQAETLRDVAAEAAEESFRSPRVSWNPGPDDIQQHALALDSAAAGQRNETSDKMRAGASQDALAVAQNGGLSGTDADDGDLDGDAEVEMDDDMMDKISSSPSIEDGGSPYALPTLSSSRPGTPPQLAILRCPSATLHVGDSRSSSPYLESPDHLPLRGGGPGHPGLYVAAVQCTVSSSTRRHHHLAGEFDAYAATDDAASNETRGPPEDLDLDDDIFWVDEHDGSSAILEDLDDGYGTPITGSTGPGLGKGTQHRDDEDDDDDLTVPYESDEDDDGDFSGFPDPRFIDSGWGGECLQDTEDIDFDFVYALHTFVATVEGQANATKGDTMVLLDDSNSYWWLVRVVKDSSIGKPRMETNESSGVLTVACS